MTTRKTYTFVVTSGISVHVEAESLEKVVEKAQTAAVMGLCHHCARGEPGEWSTSGEIDCDPSSAELVDAYADGEPLLLETASEVWRKGR